MLHFQRRLLVKAFELLDLLIMVLAFALATSGVYYFQIEKFSFAHFLSMRVTVQNVAIFLAFVILWHVLFSLFGLYQSRRLSTPWNDMVDVIKASSLGSLAILVASVFLKIGIINASFLAIFWLGSSGLTILTRLVLRHTLERLRLRGRNLRHVLIVGTNPRALEFARKIETKRELGYRIIGFVDDHWNGTGEFRKSGYMRVVNFKQFADFLRDHVVDEVVIGLPMKSFYQEASRIVALCEEQGIITRFLSSIFNPKLARSRVEEPEEESVITLYSGAMEGWPILAKRILDFSFSLLLLLILAPLFLITAVLIKITSAGPIFFVQERVGLNKRRFYLFKFRTMIREAEEKLAELEHLNEVSGPVFKIKNDPRVTGLGKILRKTSIDELPQLFNVLKGDMSLVGPRPLPVRDYAGFDQDCLRRRFSVRPGITCLWQINGRSSIPFLKWMELDMEYIDQWSLSLDFKILAKTIPAVLKGSGAA
jgi:exopolysaccharide biosynthesis polyprenyl glycosylphosphotransferase